MECCLLSRHCRRALTNGSRDFLRCDTVNANTSAQDDTIIDLNSPFIQFIQRTSSASMRRPAAADGEKVATPVESSLPCNEKCQAKLVISIRVNIGRQRAINRRIVAAVIAAGDGRRATQTCSSPLSACRRPEIDGSSVPRASPTSLLEARRGRPMTGH